MVLFVVVVLLFVLAELVELLGLDGGPDLEGDVNESDGIVWCCDVSRWVLGARGGESRYSAGMMVVDGDDLSGATPPPPTGGAVMLGGMIILIGRPAVLDPRLGRDVRLAGVGEMSAEGFIDTTRALLVLEFGVVGIPAAVGRERAREAVVTLLPRLLFLLLATLVPAAVDADSERSDPATELLSGVPMDGLLGVPSPETRRAAKPGD